MVLYSKNEAAENSKRIQLFLASCIYKSLGHQYSWGDSISNRKIQTDQVLLPTKNHQPDYAFMESFIADMEAERLAELETYLLATGLKDTTLTDEEENALKAIESVAWGEYKLGDLFEFEAIKQARSQKEIPNDDTKDGVPYIVQSVFNNMFSRNVNKQWLVDNNEPPVTGNRIVLGVTLPAVSYQPSLNIA